MKVQEVNKNRCSFCTLKKGEYFRKGTDIYIKVDTFYVPTANRANPDAPQIACNAVNLANGNFENIDVYEGVTFCPDATISF